MGGTFSVKQMMERYQVDRRVVMAWVKSGELQAINASTSLACQKPRLRFTEESVMRFDKRREVAPAQPLKKRQRKSKQSASPWAAYL